MLNIPESIKTLFKTDGVFKNFRVHFPNGEHADLTNSDIVSESAKFTESICSKEVFQFGLSERSQIEFECVNMPNIYGVTIECGIEIDTSSLTAQEIADIQSGTYDGTLVLEGNSDIGFGYYRVPYGVFVVQDCPRSQGAMWRRKVTAYSYKPNTRGLDRYLQTVMFPRNVFPVRMNGLKALFDTSMRLQKTIKSSRYLNTFTLDNLFSKAGNEFSIQIDNVETYYTSIDSSDTVNYAMSFAEISFTKEEAKKNLAFGKRIAECLTALNYNFLYNDKKEKLFVSNMDMLQHRAGELFAPTVKHAINYYRSDSDFDTYFDNSMDFIMNSGDIVPAIQTNSGVFPSVRSVIGGKTNATFRHIRYVHQFTDNSTLHVFHNGSETRSINIGQYGFTMNPSVSGFAVASANLGEVLKIKATNRTDGAIMANKSNNTDYRYFNGYSFVNTITTEKLLNDICETDASFMSPNRNGGYTQKQVSQTTANLYRRDEFSDLWYDDYSINNIGSISLDYGDQMHYDYINPSYEDGSVYCISDNDVFNYLATSDEETNETIFDDILSDFLTDARNALELVTPTTMDAIGLPYLEAGDRINVNDGTNQIVALMLNRTISGIQVLRDDIECKGGTIKNDEV